MDVRAATAEERVAAARRIFGTGDQAARFLELISTGQFDPRDLLVAVESGELRGAMIAQTLPGHLAVAAPPCADDDAIADLLVLTALDNLEDRGVRLAQAYLDPVADTAALERHGFCHITQIEYRRLRNGEVFALGDPILHFAREFNETEFGSTLIATYEGSLDAPEANIGANAADVLAGYRHGNTSPNWWLVSQNGTPVGVLLLAEKGRVGEIEYFGVVPSARGRGIGAAILHHAISTFQRLGIKDLSVAVDVRNLPAGKLYDRLGFQPFRVQNLLLRNIS